LKAELAAAPFLGVKTLYEPGPGVADLRDSIARDLMAWKAARSDGEAPRAELEPEAGMARLFEGGRRAPRAEIGRDRTSTRGFQKLRPSSQRMRVTYELSCQLSDPRELPFHQRIARTHVSRFFQALFLKAFGPHVVSELPCFYTGHSERTEVLGHQSTVQLRYRRAHVSAPSAFKPSRERSRYKSDSD
jgi:hypothetical protein